ncbi:hypothetical protein CLIB1423_15S01530 [[Candida] railenensis]|uniref:Uncharacterized protein n=1 Tax=[Candida] railenensis TaxID=45579 RepID=A0A9P0QSM8_9ASCO|nr:hypothetical protein CLIB1423_15S01530 [[Candida] railenensis]
MRNTELSDSMLQPRTETQPSSAHSVDTKHLSHRKDIIQEEVDDISFNISDDEARNRETNGSEHGEDRNHQGSEGVIDAEEDEDSSLGAPAPSEHAFAYQNKLKYLPNVDFKGDITKSFNLSSLSPPSSIPNTFKYKSHPNAKTKSKLGIVNYNEIDEEDEGEGSDGIVEDAVEESNQNHSESEPSLPPITSTMNEKNKKSDTTPNWMPDVLSEKWLPESVEFKPGLLGNNIRSNNNGNINNNSKRNSNSESNENYNQNFINNLDDLDFSSSVRIRKPVDSNKESLDFNFGSTGNTMIHNSRTNLNNDTPEWMKATKEYEAQKKRNQLQNIFLSVSEHASNGGAGTGVASGAGHSISSTASTPIPSLTTREVEQLQHLTQEQIQEIMEQVGPATKVPESPLKLFGTKYNTFTKDRLSNLLQRVQNKSPAITSSIKPSDEIDIGSEDGIEAEKKVENEEDQIQVSKKSPRKPKQFIIPNILEPKMNIKNFTKSGSYTEKEFLKNADDVFKDIQERGFKRNIRDVTNLSNVINNHDKTNNTKTRIVSSATSTSTPKNDKVSNISEYSSFTSGLEEFEESKQQTENQSSTNNDFTSFEGTSREGDTNRYTQLSPRNLKYLQRQLSAEMESSYTYDGSDSNSEFVVDKEKVSKEAEASDRLHDQRKLGKKDKGITSISRRLEEIETMLSEKHDDELQKIRRENELLKSELKNRNNMNNDFVSPLRDPTMDSIDDFTQDEASQVHDFIKWKRISQLKLRESPESDSGSPDKSQSFVRGRVNPNVELPIEYNNMIFDVANQKWINNEDKDEVRGSLDSIEDLVSEKGSEALREEQTGGRSEVDLMDKSTNSIMNKMKNSRKGGNGSKLEVSFHLPNSTMESEDDFKMKNSSAVTNVSQLQDSTFSQTRKRLVNIITDVLGTENLDWDAVFNISMAGFELDNLKDLERFLPRLKSLDVSKNQIRFLEGIPNKVLELNTSSNKIDNLSSFKRFHDLQVLNCSFNIISSLQSLSSNIHLTELNISYNKLVSLRGLENFSNLVTLNASNNELKGALEISGKLRNLQSLNLSDNKLESFSGIEKLKSLRVLNLNENPHLKSIRCQGRHLYLKKLSLKLNNLQDLEVECFPNLRVLRIDGNQIGSFKNQLRKLRNLEEISCKSQPSTSTTINEILSDSRDLKTFDLSGNSSTVLEVVSSHKLKFLNLNRLTLSAMNISTLPEDFAEAFPNVRELNLNFNKLKSIEPLSKLTNLKRLFIISNNIDKVQSIVSALSTSSIRKSLQEIDLRLNQVNIDFYPFVFNKSELEYSQHLKSTANIDISPIQLETLDDIESFAILYQSLNKSYDEWVDRDTKFLDKLKSTPNDEGKIIQRVNYEMLLINLFVNLRRLDGNIISQEKKEILKQRLRMR